MGGRRIALHQYPGRDKPFAEDLGRVARNITFTAYVIGDNYDIERDALQAACSSSGAGTLVHPYLGIHSVVCTECRIAESSAEGRMATFSLTFAESGLAESPTAVPDHGALVAAAVTNARQTAVAAFADAFRV